MQCPTASQVGPITVRRVPQGHKGCLLIKTISRISKTIP